MTEKNLYFEDYEVGQRYECDQIEFTEESIKDFGEKHDPRPIHIDNQAAEESMFNGLIASGFHTLTDTWRTWVDKGWENEAAICGVGLDKILWHRPVYAGDKTITKLEVIDKLGRDEKKNGIVSFAIEAYNQENKLVISYEAKVLIAYRNK